MTTTEIFLTIIQIDSPTGEEAAMTEWVTNYSRDLGFETKVDDIGNVFVRTPGQGKPIFFCGHMDTVEPGRGIQPIIADGWIKSSGDTILGADNKAAVAGMLNLLQQVKKSPKNFRPIEMLFTVSEEVENYGAIAFDTNQLKATQGYIFDASIDVGTIIEASPFYARFDATIQGVSAHAGYREQAKSGVPVMLELVQRLEGLRTVDGLINIGIIEAGLARNTVIGELTLRGEIRAFDETVFNNLQKDLEATLSSAYALPIKYEVVVENSGYVHTPEKVAVLKKRVSDFFGHPVKSLKTFGVSDANILNSAKLTIFNLGSGGVESHTVSERILVSDLNKMSRLMCALASID